MNARRFAQLTMLLGLLPACREPVLVPPRSLEGPTEIAVARGDVCLTTFDSESGVIGYSIDVCPLDQRGSIGLVINERSDRLALLDLGLSRPRLVDLDATTPGPNHLKVGRLPVDLAVSPDGTAAYVLNQLDRDVSIVDLRAPEVLAERYAVEGSPVAMAVEPQSGEVVVAAGSPSQLFVFEGATDCDEERSEGEFRCDVTASEVEPRLLALPGTVSDVSFDPRGDEAWIVYRDLDYASVVSLAPTPDGFDTPCLNGIDEKPCVTAQVPLTYGCRDGLDNDGDGLVDQQDPQCWGARGAESPTGVGRRVVAACSNGIDDDDDGLVDREDPECMAGSGASEESATFDEPPVTACNDGVDNDGDGNVDYPDDPSCHGPFGRSESDVDSRGYDAVDVDTHGAFVYVTDRGGEQVLVLDRRRKTLIDAAAARVPAADAFDAGLGIDVIPSPLDVTGVVERSVVYRDPDDEEHLVVRYDFGAWLASNDGSLQYVQALETYCEVDGEELSSIEDFAERRQGDLESACMEVPVLPLRDATFRVVANDPALPEECLSDDFVACAECVEAGSESCEPCDAFAESQFDLCSRAFVREDVVALHNPRFTLVDAGGDQARLLGAGQCELPDALVEQMSEYAQENASAPQGLSCDSLLAPQPLATEARLVETTETNELEELPRASIATQRTLTFDTAEPELPPIVLHRPYDVLVVDETITVTYEGSIAAAARSDAVLARSREDDGSIRVDLSVDACEADVRVGDRFVILSEPESDCDIDGTLEYEIVEVGSGSIRIDVVDEEDFAQRTPRRNCFETAVGYEVRPVGEWIVQGDVLGLIAPFESFAGRCVPRYGAERRTSRATTGELFSGPYYSFYLFPGFEPEEVDPVRGQSYSFQFSSGFAPLAFPTCSSEGQQCAEGLFPTDVTYAPVLPGGSLLLAPDPNDNFIHVRNLDDAAQGYTVIR